MAIGIRTVGRILERKSYLYTSCAFSFSSRERLLRSYVLRPTRKVQAPLSCPMKCPTSVLPTSGGTFAALVVGYGMLGNIPTRDLPALAGILAFAMVERVVESFWCRLAVMAVGTALASWLVVGG